MLDILRAMGARAEVEGTSITVHPSALHGVDVDMGHCPDLVPTVAVLAAFAQGPTRVRNVAHLRIKESDRITAPATELARLGVRVDEHDDGLTVHGLGPDGPAWDEAARFSAHNDHRIPMSLAPCPRTPRPPCGAAPCSSWAAGAAWAPCSAAAARPPVWTCGAWTCP